MLLWVFVYGGPDGEIGASMRYLSQRYSMENRIAAGTLTDIGTEELAHSCWKWLYEADIMLVVPLSLWHFCNYATFIVVYHYILF